MTVTYPTVLISGEVYETLAELDYVKNYLGADPDGAAFLAMSEDQQGQRIVLASRVVSRLRWPGQKTDPDQAYAFPRTGMTLDGQAVDPDSIPGPIVDAVAELSKFAANGVDIASTRTTTASEKMIKAGSVQVENFRDITPSSPLPWPAWQLLLPYLSGSSSGSSGPGGARARGTCGKTATRPGFGYTAPL